jgi:carbamoyl-phosphate synthase large subunit
VVHENKLYVIEVNPRSSRTVPFLSKVTKVPMINLATRAAMGQSLASLGYSTGLLDPVEYTAVKAPVFSFAKITQVDIALGPEMKSTGEVIGIDYHFERALYKAIIASGIQIPDEGAILLTIADKDKQEALEIARGYAELGYPLVATEGTAKMFTDAGLKVESVRKVSEGSPHILDLIKQRRDPDGHQHLDDRQAARSGRLQDSPLHGRTCDSLPDFAGHGQSGAGRV